jgi:hypothetical protein
MPDGDHVLYFSPADADDGLLPFYFLRRSTQARSRRYRFQSDALEAYHAGRVTFEREVPCET